MLQIFYSSVLKMHHIAEVRDGPMCDGTLRSDRRSRSSQTALPVRCFCCTYMKKIQQNVLFSTFFITRLIHANRLLSSGASTFAVFALQTLINGRVSERPPPKCDRQATK